MNYLLDTHALIWLLEGDENLSKNARQMIENQENVCLISSATLWEIAIKVSIEKLEMQLSYGDFIRLIWENGIEVLDIKAEHCIKLLELPFHHKDPFDRLIIAQSIVEDMTIISRDSQFANYPAKIIW
jgi:PIN domain nuclease of toxin-antitoxin system